MTWVPRLAVALGVGLIAAWAVASCGSGTSGAVAEQAKQAASDATTQETATAKTKTVTQPAKTTTVTETTTLAQPTHSSTTNIVAATPTSTTGSGSDSGGLPWWGWVLVALGVVGVGLVMFKLGHDHGARAPVSSTSRR